MKLKIIFAGVSAMLIVSCTASVNKASVQATATAPTSMQVETVRIPYDTSKPMYVVTVEPLQVGAEDQLADRLPVLGNLEVIRGGDRSAGSVPMEVVLLPMLMQRPYRA
jgi:hypothetical protein